jgi:hypothetical protein
MKKIAALLLVLAGSAANLDSQQALNDKVVLIIAQESSDSMDLMIAKEVTPMINLLKKAGYGVAIASESGKLILGSSNSIKPDIRLSDVDPTRYVGVVVPCMGVDDYTPVMRTLGVEIIRKAVSLKIPVAAQMAGVELLAVAGVLDGKQFALQKSYVSTTGIYNSDDTMYDLAPTAIYKGTGVIQDGLIITSGTCPYKAAEKGLPDGTIELTKKFIDMLSLTK